MNCNKYYKIISAGFLNELIKSFDLVLLKLNMTEICNNIQL